MEHHFRVEVAKQVGIEKAVLLYNLDFWIRKNKANKDHFRDGRTWTYNSSKAFVELLPYMKERSIAQRLQELEEDGFLISSKKYNDSAYNHTKWYSLTEKYMSISEIRQSNSETCQSLNEQIVNTDSKHTPYSPSQGTHVVDKHPRAKGSNPRNKVTAAASNNGELFEQFWTVYPRKVGRKKCRKIWDRLKPSAELSGQIVTAVRAYRRTDQWLKDNGSFIPHPATWLNEARWEDDIPAKPEPQRGDPGWLPTEQEAQQIMRDSGLIK
ncbi:hypothetical protein ES703_28936 [subsurface metagenome]